MIRHYTVIDLTRWADIETWAMTLTNHTLIITSESDGEVLRTVAVGSLRWQDDPYCEAFEQEFGSAVARSTSE